MWKWRTTNNLLRISHSSEGAEVGLKIRSAVASALKFTWKPQVTMGVAHSHAPWVTPGRGEISAVCMATCQRLKSSSRIGGLGAFWGTRGPQGCFAGQDGGACFDLRHLLASVSEFHRGNYIFQGFVRSWGMYCFQGPKKTIFSKDLTYQMKKLKFIEMTCLR